MSYSSKAVANSFLDIAKESKSNLTPMQLQKLVYFAHGWSLALFNEPLIAESIQAWKFGPVIPSLYHEFKHYGSGAIAEPATELDLEEFEFVEPKLPDDNRLKALLKKIWGVYSKYDGLKLSALTHLPNTPWAQLNTKSVDDERDKVIPNDLIKDYFRGLMEKQNAAE